MPLEKIHREELTTVKFGPPNFKKNGRNPTRSNHNLTKLSPTQPHTNLTKPRPTLKESISRIDYYGQLVLKGIFLINKTQNTAPGHERPQGVQEKVPSPRIPKHIILYPKDPQVPAYILSISQGLKL